MSYEVVQLDPFDVSSVINAQRKLHAHAKDFDSKVDEFITRLAEIGRMTAQGAYGGAVDVTVTKTKDGATIVASGDAVVFLEFGAGSQVSTGNRFAKNMPFEVKRGSYSDSKNPPGQYARTGYKYWEFGGVEYEYISPRNGMEKAYEAMVRDIETLARAVFG